MQRLIAAWALACAAGLPGTGATAQDLHPPAWRMRVTALAEASFRHAAWGYAHSARDYALALELARRDNVTLDDDVLFAAAYLHDMAMFPAWEQAGVDHADQASAVVDTVLRGTGFPDEKIDAVRRAIRTHMYNRTPMGPESLYLHDADALDWLGAIGIVRRFSMIGPDGGQPDARKMAAVLERDMHDVTDHVLSPAGKYVASARNAEVMGYITQLKAESANFDTL